MDAQDVDQVGAVFFVEVLLIGDVGEVVGEHFTGVHHQVGLHIIGELDDVQGDVLGRQDVLGHGQHLGVGGGRSGHRDGLSGQGVIVHGIIVAVFIDVLDDADHGAVRPGGGDVIGNRLAGQGRGQGLGFRRFLIAFLDGEDVHIRRFGVFDQQGVLGGAEAGVQGVVVIDDGVVDVHQDVGHVGRLDFVELDVQGILGDVRHGGGDAGVFVQLDDAVGGQQQQGAGFVGGIVGHGDLQGQRGHAGQGQQSGKNDSGQFLHGCTLLFIRPSKKRRPESTPFPDRY